MNFKQFLIEQSERLDEEQIAEQIVRDCQPYLRQGGGVRFNLYRGMMEHLSAGIKQARQNRRPKNTIPVIHQYIDRWFENKFGFPYRSSGVHTSGDLEDAKSYGDGVAFCVYPIGDFSFVWSLVYDDMFTSFGSSLNTTLTPKKIDRVEYTQKQLTPDQQQHIDRFLHEGYYKDRSLHQAAESGNEVMIATEKYIFVEQEFADEINLRGKINELL